jgi:hypothetical protein
VRTGPMRLGNPVLLFLLLTACTVQRNDTATTGSAVEMRDLLDAIADAGSPPADGSPEEPKKPEERDCQSECRQKCRWGGGDPGQGAHCDDGTWDDEDKTCTCGNECNFVTPDQCQQTCADLGCSDAAVEGDYGSPERGCICSGCTCKQEPECILVCSYLTSRDAREHIEVDGGSGYLSYDWKEKKSKSCPARLFCMSTEPGLCSTEDDVGKTKAGECIDLSSIEAGEKERSRPNMVSRPRG